MLNRNLYLRVPYFEMLSLQITSRRVFWIFTFENDKNLFWVYQSGNFLSGKNISRQEKNIRKNYFAPSEKYACYAPDCMASFSFTLQIDLT